MELKKIILKFKKIILKFKIIIMELKKDNYKNLKI